MVARSATAVKRDGYLNTRARQVLRLVLPRLSRPRRPKCATSLRPRAIADVLKRVALGHATFVAN